MTDEQPLVVPTTNNRNPAIERAQEAESARINEEPVLNYGSYGQEPYVATRLAQLLQEDGAIAQIRMSDGTFYRVIAIGEARDRLLPIQAEDKTWTEINTDQVAALKRLV